VSTSDERLRILEQIDAGEIDVDDALRELQEINGQADTPASTAAMDKKRYRHWWLILLAIGLGITGLGAWLGSLGGWWWLLAGPVLLLGVLAAAFAMATSNSMWVHVRVHTGQDSWPRRIAISMPIPLRLSAWFLRRFGHRIPQLDNTSVDELLVALQEGVSADSPIFIEVAEGERGERVEVRLG
jgi:hypothetical protein